MKVLLLSAYAAHSHVYWQNSLQAMFGQWQWQVLSLPPRHLSWRARGNPLYWAMAERELLERGYDLLIATSMVDLATLRGLVPGGELTGSRLRLAAPDDLPGPAEISLWAALPEFSAALRLTVDPGDTLRADLSQLVVRSPARSAPADDELPLEYSLMVTPEPSRSVSLPEWLL